MEKAILKTLIYSDIFDYPLKAWEIHKWLIGKKAALYDIEKLFLRESLKLKIDCKDGYYYLKGRKKIVEKRLEKEKQSRKFLKDAKIIAKLFQFFPGVLLVGISGNLAMESSDKNDDIDLFVITKKGSLWTDRILMLGFLSLLDKRRSRHETKGMAAGKICLNLLLDEDNLVQKHKDVYLAHEVLQMRVLWQRGKIYQKFLEENEWAFKFLPNWTSSEGLGDLEFGSSGKPSYSEFPERLAKWLQLRYMGKPSGKERITEGAVYFHPVDYREKILTEFKKRCVKLGVWI